MAEKRAWLTDPITGEKLHAWAHVKSIFYNKASNILLKDKLDEMDRIIDEKVAKALMSNVQVNDATKVPTSALAYNMQNAITKNAEDITKLNSDVEGIGKTMISHPSSSFSTEVGKTYELCSLDLPEGKWLLIGATLATGNLLIENADFSGTSRNWREKSAPETTMLTIAFSSGGKKVKLMLVAAYVSALVHSDRNYCYLRAIRIG